MPGVFVTNLAEGVDYDLVYDLFGEVGDHETVVLGKGDPESRTTNIIGFIEYPTMEMAIQAVKKFNNKEVSGLFMNVILDDAEILKTVSEGISDGTGLVIIRNLDNNLQADQIEEMLASFGEIIYCFLPTGQNRGYCYVQFRHAADAKAVMNNHSFMNDNGISITGFKEANGNMQDLAPILDVLYIHKSRYVFVPNDCEELKLEPNSLIFLQYITFAYGNTMKRLPADDFQESLLRRIEIPASVEEISDYCFSGCALLASVTFAGGSVLRRIGNNAFSCCSRLQEIEIPASVEEIGEKCFSWSSLSRITFASGCVLKRIGKEAFTGCESLEEIEIPASVEDIDDGCFKKDSDQEFCVSRVMFAEGIILKRIGKEVFCGCNNLKEIEIPASIEVIDDKCFSKCGLLRITFASGCVLKRIGKEAFTGCESLEEIEISASVEEIEEKCFSWSSLSRITFASGCVLKRTGKEVFCGCNNLKEIEIPASVEVIDDKCFSESGLLRITFASGSVLKRIGMGAFYDCRIEDIEIPATVEEIGNSCFQKGDWIGQSLTVTFASGSVLKRIGEKAFAQREELVAIDIPASVEDIGDRCFMDTHLARVTFASGSVLKRLGNEAFAHCNMIDEIELPASLETIGTRCFTGCDISVIQFSGNSNFIISDPLIVRKHDMQAIGVYYHVRKAEVSASVEAIGNECFSQVKSLTCVTFESGSVLKHIGRKAFDGCVKLREIEIPKTIDDIAADCFNGCTSLPRITFSDSAPKQ